MLTLDQMPAKIEQRVYGSMSSKKKLGLVLYDPEWAEGQAPNEIGRAQLERIPVANPDSEVLCFSVEMDKNVRMTTQEQAYTSLIWYKS